MNNDEHATETRPAGQAGPVTISITRRVMPEQADAYAAIMVAIGPRGPTVPVAGGQGVPTQ